MLACAEGADNKAVAAQLGCEAVTVGKWRSAAPAARTISDARVVDAVRSAAWTTDTHGRRRLTPEGLAARAAIVDAYVARGMPNSGRNMAAIFHRLQLTFFHAGRIDSLRRPARRPSVTVSGWARPILRATTVLICNVTTSRTTRRGSAPSTAVTPASP